jgi:hypothetical protein
MTSSTDKTSLKSQTAWNHLRTIRRAKAVVDSWPKWKRDSIIFRDKAATTTSEVTTDRGEIVLHKRSA